VLELAEANSLSFDKALTETLEKLARIERWEWWRWGTVLVISLALTMGLFSLSFPDVRPDFFTDTALRGLLALVLLFDAFALYQQFKISRLRRDLASQIGMLSTLEALRPSTTVEQVQRENRRRVPRFVLDKRLKVTFGEGRNQKYVYGRTRDVGEGGIGVVLTDAIEPGTRALLEFPVDFQDMPIQMMAIVCYRRGFSHGLEWMAPEPKDMALVRRICSTCPKW
jgi:PilZ domain